MTKLDVLDGLETLRICVGYKNDGQVSDILPVGAETLSNCEPIYEELPGWKDSTVGVKTVDGLPANARSYLERMEALCEVPIDIIGLRPGEKLREELTVQGLELLATAEAGVWVARQRPVDSARLLRAIRAAETAVRTGRAARALRLLSSAVPEYEASAEATAAATRTLIGRPSARTRGVGRPTSGAVRATA